MTERQPGSDPIGELQRWLVRSGARSVTRELGDQVRTVLGGNTHGDVWESATAGHESPDCQWCPICRARRRLRETGPGLSSTLAAAGDAVSVVLQDAAHAFEAAVAAAGRQARPQDTAPAGGAAWGEATDKATGEPAGAAWGEVTDKATGEPAGAAWGEATDKATGEPAASAGAWDEATGESGRPLPRIVPDPPAGTDPGPSVPSGPGE